MSLFTTQEQELIANTIAEAEKATSGEIRVAVEKHCKGSAFDRATEYQYLWYFYDLQQQRQTHKLKWVVSVAQQQI